MQTIKTILIGGLILGLPLAVVTYLFLTIQGNQLKALQYAHNVNEAYETASIEKPATDAYNALGSTNGMWSGDDYELQPALGMRLYDKTYDPAKNTLNEETL